MSDISGERIRRIERIGVHSPRSRGHRLQFPPWRPRHGGARLGGARAHRKRCGGRRLVPDGADGGRIPGGAPPRRAVPAAGRLARGGRDDRPSALGPRCEAAGRVAVSAAGRPREPRSRALPRLPSTSTTWTPKMRVSGGSRTQRRPAPGTFASAATRRWWPTASRARRRPSSFFAHGGGRDIDVVQRDFRAEGSPGGRRPRRASKDRAAQRHHRLDAPREGPRQPPPAGQARPPQARLPARQAGEGDANGHGTGRGPLGRLSRVSHRRVSHWCRPVSDRRSLSYSPSTWRRSCSRSLARVIR